MDKAINDFLKADRKFRAVYGETARPNKLSTKDNPAWSARLADMRKLNKLKAKM